MCLQQVKGSVFYLFQAKKNVTEGGTREAEQAESLLLTNKPFTSLTSHLTHLVSLVESPPHLLSVMVFLLRYFG